MSDIRTPGFTFPDPAVQQAAAHLAQAAEQALTRAVLHRVDPDEHPLPDDPDALERIFRDRLDRLPRRRLNDLARKFSPGRLPSKTRAGELPALDLRSTRSALDPARVSGLLKPPGLKPLDSLALLDEIKLGLPGLLAETGVVGLGEPVAGSLQLRLLRAQCVEPTALEFGRDEIALGCIIFDELGTTLSTGPLSLGDFKRGQIKDFSANPKILHTIDLAGVALPKAYAAIPILAEIDFGDFSDVLLMAAATSATTAVTWIAAGLIGGSPLLVILGLMFAGSAALNAVVGLLGQDDVLELPGYGPIAAVDPGAVVFAGGSATSPPCDVQIKDRGADYRLRFDYKLVM
jgi:hypothetical protein